ncbi:hypothetical protein [Deinococcus daejeonensis]|uniref:Uncharacterized protein n=1 Tax=Deinococcus daejeonensis TaxID=1007098 RepID=A0ABQ2J871_9DEIO|nr:hypothetical protein [Deinococcus daejeonensis]GGN40164.1 hypothetical protein GCM10010842_24720 [Deinococcus daejeonensis]
MSHPEDARSQASRDVLSAATELERAAHLLAARGHLLPPGQTLDDLATTHARRSQPDRP